MDLKNWHCIPMADPIQRAHTKASALATTKLELNIQVLVKVPTSILAKNEFRIEHLSIIININIDFKV
jgi:hypothetical protein